jgi:succinate-semialdehyde dehydrogenase/glutarate-semialdehyde dehydrogenase
VADIVDTVNKTRRAAFPSANAPIACAAQVLRADATDYARLMAQEIGKPVRDGVAEAQKCALACD